MQKITPFLWFDGNAEEAINFYVSIFKHSKIIHISRGPDGKVFAGTFSLDGQEFFALNGGPKYKFTPAISMYVNCTTQEEVDELWDKLVAGGEPSRCGWLIDQFGLSWQIIPSALGELMNTPDPEKARRVQEAMLTMSKINIDALYAAYEGK